LEEKELAERVSRDVYAALFSSPGDQGVDRDEGIDQDQGSNIILLSNSSSSSTTSPASTTTPNTGLKDLNTVAGAVGSIRKVLLKSLNSL